MVAPEQLTEPEPLAVLKAKINHSQNLNKRAGVGSSPLLVVKAKYADALLASVAPSRATATMLRQTSLKRFI
jgi:hypothetical protein